MEDLEDHALAQVRHVALLEGEHGVGGEEVGGARHENSAVGTVALARCALVPHNVRPARGVEWDRALVARLVLEPSAEVLEHAPLRAKERVEVPAQGRWVVEASKWCKVVHGKRDEGLRTRSADA